VEWSGVEWSGVECGGLKKGKVFKKRSCEHYQKKGLSNGLPFVEEGGRGDNGSNSWRRRRRRRGGAYGEGENRDKED